MIKKYVWIILAPAIMSLWISCGPSPYGSRQGAPIPQDQLEGRWVTAKIDLPLRKGMLVYGNGEIDFRVYRIKLEALGASIRRHEHARITKVRQKGRELRISLNDGGWSTGLNQKAQLRWKLPEQMNGLGSMIVIDFGRTPTPDDMKPKQVAYALRNVLEIAGLDPVSPKPAPSAPSNPAVPAGAKMLSAEARPSRVRAGETLDLAVHFEVAGAAGENPLALTIHRQVYQGGDPLFSAPKTQQGRWAAGVHSAHFRMNVPEAAAPGVYRFKAWVSHGGEEESREVLFEILAGSN